MPPRRIGGMRLSSRRVGPLQSNSGISLIFAAGARPTASDIERFMAGQTASGQAGRISFRPPDDHGWLEILASGLTYDLRGLAPGSGAPLPPAEHRYGLPAEIEQRELEPISLAPGAHITAGGPLMPVVRILLGLAAGFALEMPIAAICWNPAATWMEPKYFGRIVVNWLSGGAFPALGLTGLCSRADGGIESSGLAYFTGQEVCLPGPVGRAGPEAAKLAGRVIDHLVRHGPIDRCESIAGPGGENLLLEPSADGRHVLVARAA